MEPLRVRGTLDSSHLQHNDSVTSSHMSHHLLTKRPPQAFENKTKCLQEQKLTQMLPFFQVVTFIKCLRLENHKGKDLSA